MKLPQTVKVTWFAARNRRRAMPPHVYFVHLCQLDSSRKGKWTFSVRIIECKSKVYVGVFCKWHRQFTHLNCKILGIAPVATGKGVRKLKQKWEGSKI